jgi:hypothetical protein
MADDKDKHIDVTKCVECGCDRGGFIDLSARQPVLTCFECTNKKAKENVKR